MAYEWSQAEEVDLAHGGQAEGGDNGPKHRNGLPGAQPSPRATFPNTPKVSNLQVGPATRPQPRTSRECQTMALFEYEGYS